MSSRQAQTAETPALFTRLNRIEAGFYAAREPKQTRIRTQARSSIHIITQNVCGFKRGNRLKWLRAWKRQGNQADNTIWCMQETHITDREEIEELERYWRAIWGVGPGDQAQYTFWSLGTTKKGGVGILLHPHKARAAGATIETVPTTTRSIAVQVGDVCIVNIYAPNTAKEREMFYKRLADRELPVGMRTVMAGDFNCVLDAHRDRLRTSLAKTLCESQELVRLIHKWRLIDAEEGLTHIDGNARQPTVDRMTFWRHDTGSRIDRIYVSMEMLPWIQGIQASVLPLNSDHQTVSLRLRDPTIERRHVRLGGKYPFWGLIGHVCKKGSRKQFKLGMQQWWNQLGTNL